MDLCLELTSLGRMGLAPPPPPPRLEQRKTYRLMKYLNANQRQSSATQCNADLPRLPSLAELQEEGRACSCSSFGAGK